MSKLTKTPTRFILGTIFLAFVAVVITYLGLFDSSSFYQTKLHPFYWYDSLGLFLLYSCLAFQSVYWIVLSPEKNKSKLSDDNPVLNFIGLLAGVLGFILTYV